MPSVSGRRKVTNPQASDTSRVGVRPWPFGKAARASSRVSIFVSIPRSRVRAFVSSWRLRRLNDDRNSETRPSSGCFFEPSLASFFYGVDRVSSGAASIFFNRKGDMAVNGPPSPSKIGGNAAQQPLADRRNSLLGGTPLTIVWFQVLVFTHRSANGARPDPTRPGYAALLGRRWLPVCLCSSPHAGDR